MWTNRIEIDDNKEVFQHEISKREREQKLDANGKKVATKRLVLEEYGVSHNVDAIRGEHMREAGIANDSIVTIEERVSRRKSGPYLVRMKKRAIRANRLRASKVVSFYINPIDVHPKRVTGVDVVSSDSSYDRQIKGIAKRTGFSFYDVAYVVDSLGFSAFDMISRMSLKEDLREISDVVRDAREISGDKLSAVVYAVDKMGVDDVRESLENGFYSCGLKNIADVVVATGKPVSDPVVEDVFDLADFYQTGVGAVLSSRESMGLIYLAETYDEDVIEVAKVYGGLGYYGTELACLVSGDLGIEFGDAVNRIERASSESGLVINQETIFSYNNGDMDFDGETVLAKVTRPILFSELKVDERDEIEEELFGVEITKSHPTEGEKYTSCYDNY
ncbi:hypothetical protein ACFLYT_00930 [Nanoarchaeota archaeon]